MSDKPTIPAIPPTSDWRCLRCGAMNAGGSQECGGRCCTAIAASVHTEHRPGPAEQFG